MIRMARLSITTRMMVCRLQGAAAPPMGWIRAMVPLVGARSYWQHYGL